MQTRPHHTFWPRRLPRAMNAPRTPLWDNLAVNARRFPDKAALIFMGSTMSYAQLWSAVERFAARLHELGVRRGDRVMLAMQNCPQLVVAHFAILRADAVVVPVNPMNRAEELKHFIVDPDARVAIATADLAVELAKASDALPEGLRLRHLVVTQFTDAFDPAALSAEDMPVAWAPWLLTRRDLPSLAGGAVHGWTDCLAREAAPPASEADSDDLALLPYTSGTTGLPKGCMLSHANAMHNAMAINAWGNVTPESVQLVAVPMFHITGMVGVMHAAILAGVTMVLMPRWDRELAGRLISACRVTHWANIPTMVIDLLASPNVARFDLSSLVSIGGGGAAMPQAVAQRLFEQYGLRYIEAYGLTETAAPSHYNPPEAPKLQCLGIPFMSVDARVIDPETGREVGQGAMGEIVIHGPQVFGGYWKRPDDTAATFIEIDGKSFFRSGDMGHVDEEGYFFATDRLKRMINASGFKVWPAEVEALMFRHPAIQEACVIATKDAYRGESVKALVVRKPAQPPVSEQDIVDWCRENMAAYKVPRVVQFVDALPKSGSGKVMWRALQEAEAAAST
ncbi:MULTISPECIES: long-chain fatty acid--CoA ligase [unclassified Variovorax]|uniref:long-chain fatty acid--CoA ligase n=1 Tax=unclassified Variovorax TaxID=663243 RepID=UPI000F7E6F49|nr:MULTISPECIES: long-chain fatty acid--CoA ligase [unclassified Variovorax]RSZ39597.1 long-chain fatty acid--CoA ligase [Variovorax sp. 553]RSZ40699.1 long-chain fatty acid--CoA ligase [Variovorax sp. 679]